MKSSNLNQSEILVQFVGQIFFSVKGSFHLPNQQQLNQSFSQIRRNWLKQSKTTTPNMILVHNSSSLWKNFYYISICQAGTGNLTPNSNYSFQIMIGGMTININHLPTYTSTINITHVSQKSIKTSQGKSTYEGSKFKTQKGNEYVASGRGLIASNRLHQTHEMQNRLQR